VYGAKSCLDEANTLFKKGVFLGGKEKYV